MKKLVLVAAMAITLPGCASLTLAKFIDTACVEAVKATDDVQDLTDIAMRHGIKPKEAEKLAKAAVHGEDVARRICLVTGALM
jgi:hypothetical protein